MRRLSRAHEAARAIREAKGATPAAKDVVKETTQEREARQQKEELEAAIEALSAAEEELRAQNEQLAASRAQLEEAKARYQDLFDTAPYGYVVTDRHGTIQEANKAASTLLTRGTASLKGTALAHVFPEKARAEFDKLLSRLRDSGKPIRRWEVEIWPLGGPAFWASITASASCDEKGKVTGLRWLFRDVTARKQAEDALRAATARFQTIVDNAPIAIYVKDRDGRFVFGNRTLERYTGRPLERLLGMTDYDIAPREDADRWRANDRKVLEGQRAEFEETGTDRDGRPYVNISVKFPLSDKSGTPVEVCGISTDITARIKVEEALRQSEGQLRRARELLEAVTVGTKVLIATVDKAFRYTFFNQEHHDELKRLTGKDIRIGMSLKEVLAGMPNERDKALALWRRALKGETVVETVEFGDPGRRRRWYSTRHTPIRDESGAIVGAGGVTSDITELVQAQRAMRESEGRYRSLFHNMTEGFALHQIVVDGQGRPVDYTFLEVNPAFERLTGLKREDLLGRRVLEVMPGTEPYWIETFGRVALTGEPATFENYAAALGRWYGVFAYRPAPGQFAVIFSDITVRRQAEEALRQSEQRYRGVVENTSAIILRVSSGGIITYANGRALAFFGYPEEELIGKPAVGTIVPPVETTGRDLAKMVDEIAADPDRFSFNANENMRKGGQRVWMEWTNSGLYGADGRLEGFLCVGIDATARKQAEEALRQNEELLRAVTDNSPDAVYVKDRQSRWLMANPAVLRAVGKSAWQALGKTDLELCADPEVGRAIIANDRRVLEEGRPQAFEEVADTPDGRRTFLSVKAPRRDAQGNIIGIVGISHDITEQKQAEAALRSLNEELEARVKERTAELEQRTAQLRALAAELTMAEQRERKRMAQVLHDHLQQLLVGARYRMGFLHKAEDRDVAAAAHEVGDLLAQSIEVSRTLTGELSPPILHEGGLVPALEWLAVWMQQKHAMTVDLAADDNATPSSEEMKVLLFQSIRELLFNAAKHAKVKSARVEVRRTDGHISVVVSDQGAGFDPSQLRTGGGSGGGFGLFSIRERLDLLGGRMEIASAPGKGSTFRLWAPVAAGGPALPAAPAPRATITKVSGGQANGPSCALDKRIRVLLVDDHIVVRQGLARLLKEEGDIEIVGEASDGRTAVDLARRLLPDVVMMDVDMPVMNGVEATRAIAEECPAIRVIGLSMFDEKHQARAMRKAGACDYVTKTGPSEALVAAIRRVATQRHE